MNNYWFVMNTWEIRFPDFLLLNNLITSFNLQFEDRKNINGINPVGLKKVRQETWFRWSHILFSFRALLVFFSKDPV